MKLIGIARIGKDAELRYTPSGKAVANISLAYNYGQKGQDGNRPTQWVEASIWDKQAERLAPYLLKGAVFNVMCRDVHIETYEGKNGIGSKLVGTIADIEFVPKQVDGRVSESPKTQVADVTDNFEDDIPF